MIETQTNDAVVRFAAEELARCATKLDPKISVAQSEGGAARALALLVDPARFCVADAFLDDAYEIDVRNLSGFIAGSNPRSVLLGVYRLLREWGMAFLRPGAEGEKAPSVPTDFHAVTLREAAARRHRGVCVEGASSYEHIRDMIDYLPKIGLNAYFLQFMTPFTFLDKWYSHRENEYLKPEPFDLPTAKGLTRALIREIKKRGLLYHAVGHGWTCEPFGIEGDSWEKNSGFIPEETRNLLAEIAGKRALYGDVALNTNLCYGNPKAFEGIVSAIVNYCLAEPDVDYLHFWLADDPNNHCECPLCKDTRPSDFYVRMLNELDARLTRNNLRTRLVFLLYNDLLWPPETQRLINPSRFTLMFAPITRTYSRPFLSGEAADSPIEPQTPYARNRLSLPRTVQGNLRYLRDWQKQFEGDSFDFDYHLMWDLHYDPGAYRNAEVLFADAQNLKRLGLNGMMSCQMQRVGFPVCLSLYAMAEALWNPDQTFEAVVRRYMGACFGDDAREMTDYFRDLSALFDPPYLRIEKPVVDPETAENYARLPLRVFALAPLAQARLLAAKTPFEKHLWMGVLLHGQLCVLLSQALFCKASGDPEGVERALVLLSDYVKRQEAQTHAQLDAEHFLMVFSRALRHQKKPAIY